MVNLAVVNKKDLIKYLFKITAIMIIVYFISKVLNLGKINEINFLEFEGITTILDIAIPEIKSTRQEEKINFENINYLEMILKMELGVTDNLKRNENSDSSNNENIKDEVQNQNGEENIKQAETRT